jgi:hypothetical protein
MGCSSCSGPSTPMADFLKSNSPQALLQAKLDVTDEEPKPGLAALAEETADLTKIQADKAPGTGLVVDVTA